MNLLKPLFSYSDKLAQLFPEWLLNLAIRLMIFRVFWYSAQTKITGLNFFGQNFAFWNVTDTTILLFDFEYQLPLISGTVAAYLATFGEFFLSILILLGLFTRFAALGFIVMTLVIQFFVYPDAWWSVHVFWMLLLLYVFKHGGGKASIDALLKR